LGAIKEAVADRPVAPRCGVDGRNQKVAEVSRGRWLFYKGGGGGGDRKFTESGLQMGGDGCFTRVS
jgi:hypothetical protein